VQANATMFQASGIPSSIFESQEMWDDLLMHGYIDHHDDPTRFFIGQLSPDQANLLIELAVRYLQSGFGDPGIGGFVQANEIRRRAGIS
jgi:hypothetical protein